MADSWDEFKSELAKRGVHLEFVYKDKEQTKVQGIRFCKDGYSFKGTQISRDYSFGKLNARFEGMEKHVSSRDNSTLQYVLKANRMVRPSCHRCLPPDTSSRKSSLPNR